MRRASAPNIAAPSAPSIALQVLLDQGRTFALLGLATLGNSVAAIVLQGRGNGAVRYLAYAMFADEVLYLASQTVGTMLGTSGLFLSSGIFVAVLAWLVIRLERRFGGKQKRTVG